MHRVFEDVLSEGNLEIIPELIATEYRYQSPLGLEAGGPDGFKEMVVAFRSAFPDLRCIIDNILAEGDYVALNYTMNGTFRGEFAGIQPTGKQFSLPGSIFVRLINGKEAEATGFYDTLTFYTQLGVPVSGG